MQEKLKKHVLTLLGTEKIHPLQEAILDETLEDCIKQGFHLLEEDEKNRNILISFNARLKVMEGTIKGLMLSDADTITINYRNQTFVLDKKEAIVIQALK